MSSQWIHKIKNLEVPPPAGGWDKVSAAMDESLNGLEFPTRLRDKEAVPPTDTWNKITSLLDLEKTPVVPLQQPGTGSALKRYAIAACIIGLVCFAAVRLFGPGLKTKDAAQTPVVPVTPKQESREPNPPGQTTVSEQPRRENDAIEQSRQVYAKLDIREKRSYNGPSRKLYKSPAQLASSFSDDDESIKNPELQYSHRAAVSDSPPEEADRYIMFKDSYGRFIRISKKLSTLFCCVSGEEQDDKCLDQLKQWREKIASSPFNPSPDNFMDILDLVNSLQDNRN